MNNKLMTLAAASLALSVGAQADTQVYGKMNVSFNYSDTDPKTSLESNASRLGIKGSEDLASSKLIYQAEYEIDVDGGSPTPFKQRDIYIGLVYNGMGIVKMGVVDTPLKKSQGKFDLFNDVVDIKQVLTGENRMANSINYTSEKMGDIQASVSLILPEDAAGVRDEGISASVTFKQGDIYAAAAIDENVTSNANSTQRITVTYNLGDISVGGLINNVDATDSADDELGFAANVSMKMGMNTFKAQFEKGDQGEFGNDTPPITGSTLMTVGVDHKLGKASKAFAYLTKFDSDASDAMRIALGLEHKF